MAELCEGIAEVLEKRGHATRAIEDSNGRVCLLGAGRYVQKQVTSVYSVVERCLLDQRTAEALGYDNWQSVVNHNDGYVEKTVKRVPVIGELVYLVVRTEVTTEHPPLTQQQAIDFAMERAKYWRNK